MLQVKTLYVVQCWSLKGSQVENWSHFLFTILDCGSDLITTFSICLHNRGNNMCPSHKLCIKARRSSFLANIWSARPHYVLIWVWNVPLFRIKRKADLSLSRLLYNLCLLSGHTKREGGIFASNEPRSLGVEWREVKHCLFVYIPTL